MLVLFHAALGLTLGWLRPSWAVAVLLGGVAVSSGVWWQLGLGNVVTPLAYTTGFLLGMGGRTVVARQPGGEGEAPEVTDDDALTAGDDEASTDGDDDAPTTGDTTLAADDDVARVPGAIVVAGTLTVGFVLAATLLSLLREYAAGTLLLALREQAARLYDFNAGGLAGELQACLIAIAGPLVLFATAAALRDRRARELAVRAVACGATLAVATPLLQGLLADPWVRPDTDGGLSTGLVGPFQDPHSFAAYLLLAVGVVAAAGIDAARSGRRRAVWAHTILTTMILLVLFGTSSRTAMISLLIVGLCVLAAHRYGRAGSAPGRALLVPGGVLAALIVVTASIFAIAPLRQATYEGMRDIGANRLARPLAADPDWNQILGYRGARWAASLDLASRRPLWGAGPRSIEKIALGEVYVPEAGGMQPIPPENTHNYLLQFAAEYGLPAAAALIWLLAGVVSTTARGAARHSSATTRTLLAGLLAGQIGFLLMSLVGHPMLLAECQAAFWGLGGLAISSVRADSQGPAGGMGEPPGSLPGQGTGS